MTTPDLVSHPEGIHRIDAGPLRSGLVASYLIRRDGRAAFVDVGTCRSAPRLTAALETLHIDAEQVDYLLLTHVHLDHAGGAGELMRLLPHATAVVHPRGAPHLADPAKLEAAARSALGGELFDQLHGHLVPIPASRIRSIADGETLTLGRSPLRFLETPGHALHHVAIHDETAAVVFTGDAFGLSYRVFDNPRGDPFVFPTTSPTQFDPDQSHASLDRIRALRPRAAYLAHYGRVEGIDHLTDRLHRDLDHSVSLVRETPDGPEAEDRLTRSLLDYLAGRLAAHEAVLTPSLVRDWLEPDTRLNAAGLLAWKRRGEPDRTMARDTPGSR